MNKREKAYKINDLLSDLKAADYARQNKFSKRNSAKAVGLLIAIFAIPAIIAITSLFLTISQNG